MCTYTPSNTTKSSKNISESTLCWESSDMDRFLVYQLSLVTFVTISGNKIDTGFFDKKYYRISVNIFRGNNSFLKVINMEFFIYVVSALWQFFTSQIE